LRPSPSSLESLPNPRTEPADSEATLRRRLLILRLSTRPPYCNAAASSSRPHPPGLILRSAALNKMKKETTAELEAKLDEGRRRVEAKL
jgi:hypothetical protein